MPSITLGRTAGLGAAVAASALLAACGSGSSTATSAGNQQHATAQTAAPNGAPQGVPAASGGVPAPLVACLHKQGIGHPSYRAGAPLQPPTGVSTVHFERALRRCGVPAHAGSYSPPATGGGKHAGHGQRQFNTGRFAGKRLVAALDKFALCMRHHGVDLPEPDVGGRGPIFRGSSVNPSSPKFGAAEDVCFPLIKGSLPKPDRVKPRFNPGSRPGEGN